MKVRLSDSSRGKYGLVGHVGVGHVHSHSGFVQDDSAGFAVASLLLKKALPVDTTIKEVEFDPGSHSILVVTASGGQGTTSPRRGVTPREVEMMSQAIGLDAIFSQNAAVKVFGRVYGQGVLEVPVSFQGACALAALDSFKRAMPTSLLVTSEKFPNKYDIAAGTVVDIDDIPVSLMLVINGTNGGIGPDEDYEGNTPWTEKGELMRSLALDRIPTVVLESKAFIPSMAHEIVENQLMVRAQPEIDCLPFGEALFKAGKEAKIPIRLERTLMPMPNGALARATEDLADKIIAAAQKLKSANLSSEKTAIVARLAQWISEDAGGVTFMSNTVNDQMRGAGILPGISVVLSMVTTKEYQSYWKIPQLTPTDAEWYHTVIAGALKSMAQG